MEAVDTGSIPILCVQASGTSGGFACVKCCGRRSFEKSDCHSKMRVCNTERRVRSMGIEHVLSAPRSPWQNAEKIDEVVKDLHEARHYILSSLKA
jgi:hypothetical protein